MQRWLRGLLVVALALGVAGALLRRKPHEARVEPAVKRRAAPQMSYARSRIQAGVAAHHASLWRRGALGPCSVAVRWAGAPVSAHFSAVMCADGPITINRADYKPMPIAAKRPQARAVVKIQPGGAPMVRLVSAASFKPKRALYGATELRAA